MTTKKTILVLCTGNSARSQMAEGILRHALGSKYEVFSAGTKPSLVRPEAIDVMFELGIDISAHRSKSVDEFADRKIDYVLTVCDNAKEHCPFFPARTRLIHRAFSDPAEVKGSNETRRTAFRIVRDEIVKYVDNQFQAIIQS